MASISTVDYKTTRPKRVNHALTLLYVTLGFAALANLLELRRYSG